MKRTILNGSGWISLKEKKNQMFKKMFVGCMCPCVFVSDFLTSEEYFLNPEVIFPYCFEVIDLLPAGLLEAWPRLSYEVETAGFSSVFG